MAHSYEKKVYAEFAFHVVSKVDEVTVKGCDTEADAEQVMNDMNGKATAMKLANRYDVRLRGGGEAIGPAKK